MITADVIVLGVGGMGSATCYHLAKRGVKVIGLEQFTTAHDRGSSHGDTRMIRLAYYLHPNYVPLLRRAYDLWEALGRESKTQLLFKTGLVLYGPQGKSELHEKILSVAKIHKLQVSQLSHEEAVKIYPMYRPPKDYSAVFEPYAGFLKVEACVETHAELAQKHGAKILEKQKVISWQVKKRCVEVTTDQETYQAPKLIITAGAWSGEILKSLHLPLTVHRNVMFWFPASDAYRYSAGTPCFVWESDQGFFYGFPSIDKWGIKIAEHSPGTQIAHPDQLNRHPRPEDIQPLLYCLQHFLPDIPRRPTKEVVCMYTLTPDEHFIIDHHPQYPQVLFAAGFSGHGFKFSSVMGEVLADLSTKDATPYDINFLQLRWKK